MFDTQQKFNGQLQAKAQINTNRQSVLRTGQTPEPPVSYKNTMSLADKKRLQWQQEKGFYIA